MKVRQKRRPTSAPKPQVQAKARMDSVTIPAPVRGLVLNENLAATSPGGASVMDGWFPGLRGPRVRGGKTKWATIGSGIPVRSMWTYTSGGTDKFFAATETGIFNITSVADPAIIPTADVTGQTAGYYSTVTMSTVGGDYLLAFNGADTAQVYDNSSWAASTITGVDTADITAAWKYAERIFMIKNGTMSAYYLPVDSYTGAATELNLSGVFKMGGSLLFGATWSIDSGGGLSEQCLFVTTEGEIAIYQGTDPSDATNWNRVGTYQVADPLGINATINTGADLLIATKLGLVPVSAALRKQPGALELEANTLVIEPEWLQSVEDRETLPWEIVKWPNKSLMVISQPRESDAVDPLVLVAHLKSGAWGVCRDWDTRCIALFGTQVYYGNNEGVIYAMDLSGNDDGSSYTCRIAGQFEHLGTPGAVKTLKKAKATFRSSHGYTFVVSASVDYTVDWDGGSESTSDFATVEWDAGIWDSSQWDTQRVYGVASEWQSIGVTGDTHAWQIEITWNVTPTPDTELVSITLVFEEGELVE